MRAFADCRFDSRHQGLQIARKGQRHRIIDAIGNQLTYSSTLTIQV